MHMQFFFSKFQGSKASSFSNQNSREIVEVFLKGILVPSTKFRSEKLKLKGGIRILLVFNQNPGRKISWHLSFVTFKNIMQKNIVSKKSCSCNSFFVNKANFKLTFGLQILRLVVLFNGQGRMDTFFTVFEEIKKS